MKSQEITHDKVRVIFTEDFKDKSSKLIIHAGYGGIIKTTDTITASVQTYRKTKLTHSVPLSILELDTKWYQ